MFRKTYKKAQLLSKSRVGIEYSLVFKTKHGKEKKCFTNKDTFDLLILGMIYNIRVDNNKFLSEYNYGGI